jgi:hypothetical protein
MPSKLHLNEGQAFVQGRSREKAADLLKRAEEAGYPAGSVITVSFGYIVPAEIAGDEEAPAVTEVALRDEVPDALAIAKGPAAKAPYPGSEFDPTSHTVDEVITYLDGADETERERVLAAETDGKARKTVLAYDPEGAK